MRIQDWPERLDAFIKAAEKRPFCWGEFDCALFAADCVFALTGIDHAADYRGKYAEERGALRLVKKAGGLAAIATKALGQPIPLFSAQRGDVVLLKQPEIGMTLGICCGRFCAFAGPEGLIMVPHEKCALAWKVA